jgi:hypothetical protein
MENIHYIIIMTKNNIVTCFLIIKNQAFCYSFTVAPASMLISNKL